MISYSFQQPRARLGDAGAVGAGGRGDGDGIGGRDGDEPWTASAPESSSRSERVGESGGSEDGAHADLCAGRGY